MACTAQWCLIFWAADSDFVIPSTISVTEIRTPYGSCLHMTIIWETKSLRGARAGVGLSPSEEERLLQVNEE